MFRFTKFALLTLAAFLVMALSNVAFAGPPKGPTDDLNENAILSLLTPKTIFVTSSLYTGDLVGEALSLGYVAENGLDAADYLCQNKAKDAGFKGNFKAIISTSFENANARLSKSLGPYILPDGTPVAENFAHLFSTRTGADYVTPELPPIWLITEVNQTELGDRAAGGPGPGFLRRAWTGTYADGSAVLTNFPGPSPGWVVPELTTCDDWTSSAQEDDCSDFQGNVICGVVGLVTSKLPDWLYEGTRYGCDITHRLYCAEQ